jgi:hypothetical protein
VFAAAAPTAPKRSTPAKVSTAHAASEIDSKTSKVPGLPLRTAR